MRIAVSIAVLLVAGAAHAAASLAKPTAAAPSPTVVRFPGVSEAGNAVLAKAQTTPDPQLQALARQLKAIRDQLTSAVMAPLIDVEKISGILRQQDDLQSQIRIEQTDHWVTILQQLPSEDRGTVLRTMLLAKPRKGAAPAATPQP